MKLLVVPDITWPCQGQKGRGGSLPNSCKLWSFQEQGWTSLTLEWYPNLPLLCVIFYSKFRLQYKHLSRAARAFQHLKHIPELKMGGSHSQLLSGVDPSHHTNQETSNEMLQKSYKVTHLTWKKMTKASFNRVDYNISSYSGHLSIPFENNLLKLKFWDVDLQLKYCTHFWFV